jgi:hypothetical protein
MLARTRALCSPTDSWAPPLAVATTAVRTQRTSIQDGNVRVAALVFHRDGEPVGDFRKAWATACHAAGVPNPILSHESFH